jgi:hypothetical protein
LICQYDFSQYVRGRTHNAGHTLDLILARETDDCVESVSISDVGISDHSMVLCKLKKPRVQVERTFCRTRCWKKADLEGFLNDFLSSPLCDSVFLNSSHGPSSIS